MFGKGTFKSSGTFRPGASVTANRAAVNEKEISTFNEAEKAANGNETVKAVQLYSQFLQEADNTDEGKNINYIVMQYYLYICKFPSLNDIIWSLSTS